MIVSRRMRRLGLVAGVLGVLLIAGGYAGVMFTPDNSALLWLIPVLIGSVPLLIGLHAWIDWKEDDR